MKKHRTLTIDGGHHRNKDLQFGLLVGYEFKVPSREGLVRRLLNAKRKMWRKYQVRLVSWEWCHIHIRPSPDDPLGQRGYLGLKFYGRRP